MDPNSSRSRHSQQIGEQAAEWFVDFREGDVDAAGVAAFHSWLRTSPEHIEAYLEIAAWWADVPNLIAKEAIDIQALCAEARVEDNVVFLEPTAGAKGLSQIHLAESRNEVSGPTAEESATSRRRLSSRRLATVAALALVILGSATAAWFTLFAAPNYTTGIGEQRLVALEDGSTVEMDAKSQIRVRFTSHERTVDLLMGQALFRVAKNAARPFVVISGDTRVRAVGTQFDVYRRPSKTSVTVIHGRVAVLSGAPDGFGPFSAQRRDGSVSVRSSIEARGSAGTAVEASGHAGHGATNLLLPDGAAFRNAIFLDAGEQVVVSGQEATAPMSANVAAVTAWTQRQLIFQGALLPDVVEEFNRYNRRQMVITAKSLDGIRVSGVFSSTEPASLLRFLSEQLGLRVYEHEDEILISPR